MIRSIASGPLRTMGVPACKLVPTGVVCVLLALIASCGGGDVVPSAGTAPERDQQIERHDSTDSSPSEDAVIVFDPGLNGFPFGNFSGGQGSSAVKIDDLADMFGWDGLCSAGAPEACVPYPGVEIFLERLNGVLANGVCYGMSATSMNYFGGMLELSDSGAEEAGLINIQRSETLDRVIAKHHMMQFSVEYRRVLDQYLNTGPGDLAEELAEIFSNLGDAIPPYALALYSEYGGHSITPTRVEKTGEGYRIFVYDSNWPRETRWVDIDQNRNSWSYQGADPDKDAEAGKWTGVGSGSMALIPHTLPNETFECFFCQADDRDGLARGSGSVLMVDTIDIGNTALTISTSDGDDLYWTTRGRSGADAIKVYVLPAQEASDDRVVGAFLVFVPSDVQDFQVGLSQIEETLQEQSFSAVLVGSDVPTTEIRGVTKGSMKNEILNVSNEQTSGDFTVAVDGTQVSLVRGATHRSTVVVELQDSESYKAQVVDGILKEVEILETETGQQSFSLTSIMETISTPLKISEFGDGLTFSRMFDGSENGLVVIESFDSDQITATSTNAYEIAFSDGTTASFGIDENGSMLGVFSDGATSIRYEAGGGIHSTADGWIIDESSKGAYEVFREISEGVFEVPSVADLAEMTSIAQETMDIMMGIMQARVAVGTATDEPGLASSGAVDTPSAPPGSIADRMDAMASKYEFMTKMKEAASAMMPANTTAGDMLRGMLQMMADPMVATSTPNTETGTPDQASPPGPAMPDKSSTMPDKPSMMPDKSSTMPDKPSMMPDKSSMMPDKMQSTPKSSMGGTSSMPPMPPGSSGGSGMGGYSR